MTSIPKADGGWIGGSHHWGAQVPEGFTNLGIEVENYIDPQETPYGLSAPFKLLRYKNRRILYTGMHGCYPNEEEMILPEYAANQVAWVFKRAGVKWALTGGSVGGIYLPKTPDGQRIPPNTVVIPYDLVMWPNKTVISGLTAGGRIPRSHDRSIFYRMAQPFCRILAQKLFEATVHSHAYSSYHLGGVYVCTAWGRFETEAEINLMRDNNWTVVGQTVGHEAVALRREGIPVASWNLVSNGAEPGSPDGWIGETLDAMAQFYHQCPPPAVKVMAETIKSIFDENIKPSPLEQFMLTGLEAFPVPGA